MNIFTKNIAIIFSLLLFSFCVQYTAITHSNLEQELIKQDSDSEGILNGQVLSEDISSLKTLDITGTLNSNSLKISSLLGVEDFTALKTLLCSDNNLITIVDLGANVQLGRLECGFNHIANLDISSNNKLLLYCNNNTLKVLDVSNNTQLSTLCYKSNQITALNVKNLKYLRELRFNNNDLELNLGLSQHRDLTTYSIPSNSDLFCVKVDNAGDVNAELNTYSSWSKDNTTLFSEDCGV